LSAGNGYCYLLNAVIAGEGACDPLVVGEGAAGSAVPSLMIAETVEAITALDLRDRYDRIRSGLVRPESAVLLHDGNEVSPGDTVLTRLNQRELHNGRRWAKDGDQWEMVDVHRFLTVKRAGRRGGMVRLPAWYAAESVEPAYAVTPTRGAWPTIETAHAILSSPSVSCETLYVAMTRGRVSDNMYVATATRHSWRRSPQRSL